MSTQKVNLQKDAQTGIVTAPFATKASTSNAAGFNVTPGSAPSAPVNGDLWSTSAGFFGRVNGGTVGPFGSGGGGGGSTPTATIATLKTLPTDSVSTGDPQRVTEFDQVFTWNADDERPGNDVTIVKPDDVLVSAPGRWELVFTVNDFNRNFTTQGREYLGHFHSLLIQGIASKMIFSGDSTTEGGTGNGIFNPTLNNINVVVGSMMQAAYTGVTSVNAGHAGQSTALWLSTYLAQDLAANPDLYVLRWGINDGSLNPDDFLSNLEAGLLIIRQSKSSAQMSVLLMSPNATNDNPLGRNQAWYERVVPALPALARKYQCAYVDTYSLYRDAMAAITAMDSPYATSIGATSTVNGTRYQILSLGTSAPYTDFTAIGASANVVGVAFTATGAGSGNGTVATTVSAGAFTAGTDYTIVTLGTTNWPAIGAAYAAIGQTFTATGVGSGTGKAVLATHIHPHDVMNRWIGSEIYGLISPAGLQRGYGFNNVTAYKASDAMGGVTDPPSAYAYGLSISRVAAGGWVLTGTCYTVKNPDGNTLQFVSEETFAAFKVRAGNADGSGWLDWQYFVNASGLSLSATSNPSTYQIGFNIYNVTSGANGWPATGLLLSVTHITGLTSQLLIASTGSATYTRTGITSTWQSWTTTSGTNTGDQNIFASVVVAGQSTLTPNSNTTPLTLVAGTNITLTTNTTTQSVTITAAGGGGGNGNGNVIAAANLNTNALVIGAGGTNVAGLTLGTGILPALAVNSGTAGAPALLGGTVQFAGLSAIGGTAPSSNTSGVFINNAANTPSVVLVSALSPTDAKIWDVLPTGNTLLIRAVNDVYGAASTALTITRSNAAIASIGINPLTQNGLVTTTGGAGQLSITVPGTGVLTALTTNIGAAGAPVLFNGAGGTPSSLVLSNATALPAAQLVAGILAPNSAFTFGENTELKLDAVLSADGKYCGVTEDVTLGETVAFGEVCYSKAADSKWWLADADDDTTAGNVDLGMCVVGGAANATGTMLRIGKIRADAKFPTLTVGASAYVSTTPGAVTQTQPSGTDDVIRKIGFARTADELWFNPSTDYMTHT